MPAKCFRSIGPAEARAISAKRPTCPIGRAAFAPPPCARRTVCERVAATATSCGLSPAKSPNTPERKKCEGRNDHAREQEHHASPDIGAGYRLHHCAVRRGDKHGTYEQGPHHSNVLRRGRSATRWRK